MNCKKNNTGLKKPSFISLCNNTVKKLVEYSLIKWFFKPLVIKINSGW